MIVLHGDELKMKDGSWALHNAGQLIANGDVKLQLVETAEHSDGVRGEAKEGYVVQIFSARNEEDKIYIHVKRWKDKAGR